MWRSRPISWHSLPSHNRYSACQFGLPSLPSCSNITPPRAAKQMTEVFQPAPVPCSVAGYCDSENRRAA